MKVNVIGGGLAGCEAAYHIAKMGVDVALYEMKPKKFSPAHHLEGLCELVCSNSLKSMEKTSASGLLKLEMEEFDSVVLKCAKIAQVPAGGALAVDREVLSREVTKVIKSFPNIEIIHEEVKKIPEGVSIVASGPLTEGPLYEDIAKRTGEEYLNFYDAAAPIIEADSIDMDNAYFGARYGKGTADYINCPLTKEEYLAFYENLINAETIPLKENIENPKVFEGCMPVEIMAKRGVDTLRFGPLKPVGLINPKTGKEDYAVLQLRQDDVAKTMYNMVGFQTNLKWGEQKRVFSMIPALKNAVFLRYGVMHRNTYINSPKVLQKTLNLKSDPNVFFAGQITGVEGYMESAACGIIAGINAARLVLGKEMLILPQNTMMGALINYITTEGKGDFQPMNANFGIIDKGGIKAKNKKERYAEIADRSLETIKKIAQNI